MKTILQHQPNSAAINHGGTNHTLSRRGGTIEPTEQQTEWLPDATSQNRDK